MPTIYQAPVTKAKSKNITGIDVPKVPHRLRPLTAFAMAPDGIRFETQSEKETVELFLRQHFVVNIPWIFISIVLLLSPSIVFPFLLQRIPSSVIIPWGYIVVGSAFWYVATFGFILASFLYWFFNIYIVTNERVVDIDFYYLLYKRFSQAELTKIQDISYSSGGVVATIFDYGNVIIETAGEAPNLEFDKVPHPEKVVQTIRSLSERLKGKNL